MSNGFMKTRILISTAAALLTLGSQVQFGLEPTLNHTIFLIFFGTNIYYNIHRIFYHFTNLIDRNILFILQTIFTFIGFLISIIFCNFQELVLIFFVVLVASLYSFPYLKNINSLFNLREVSYIKSFIVIFIWAIVTVLLPYLDQNIKPDNLTLYVTLISNAFFMFSLIIPFDIRDIDDDKKLGLITIPILFGTPKSMMLANGSLFIYLISAYFVGLVTGKYFLLVSHLIVFIITLYIINVKLLVKNKIYYEVILDGMILLNGLAVLLFYYLLA